MKCIFTCDVFICLVYGCTYQVPSFSLRNFSEYHTTNGKNKNNFPKKSKFPCASWQLWGPVLRAVPSCEAHYSCCRMAGSEKTGILIIKWPQGKVKRSVFHSSESFPPNTGEKNLVAARKEWEK